MSGLQRWLAAFACLRQALAPRNAWRLLGAVALLSGALPAYAIQYAFPGNLPTGCVDNAGGNYQCEALTLAAYDTITFGAPKPVTLTVRGAFTGGVSVAVNSGGQAADLMLVVYGAITLGANSTLNAVVQTLGAGSVTIGAGSTIVGSLSTQTGFVAVGASSLVEGNINTVTGYVTLGAEAIVSGAVSTLNQGYVVLGALAQVRDSVTVNGGGYVTLGDSAKVGGSISTVSDAITLGANSVVGGSALVSETGAVTLGAGSRVDGNINTQTGATTVGAGGIVGGQISMNGTGAITLEDRARVYAVCCHKNDASCLIDNSGLTPGPQICVSATAVNFDCLETGASYQNVAANPGARNPIFTKLAGTAFTLDIAAINDDGSLATTYTSGSGEALKLELVEGSASTACASRVAVAPPLSPALTFASSDRGRKTVTLSAGRVYSNLRCRVTDSSRSPSTVGCSGDNFAVRPLGVTLTASATATAPSAKSLPVVAAGANFSLSTSTPANLGYGGTLNLDTAKLTAQSTAQDATVQGGGVLGVLTPSTLVADAGATNATYSEVGYLYVAPGAYRDDLLTLVDNAKGDCIADTTNDQNLSDTLINGKYGCSIGNRTALTLGRFVPHYLEVTAPVLTAACAVSTAFSYFGQDGFTTAFTLTAKNSANATTRNYTGAFARFDLTSYRGYDFKATPLPAGSVLTRSAIAPSGTWGQGVARVSAKHQVSRPAAPTPETLIAVTAAPSDGEASTRANTVVGPQVRLRFGRLQMKNAYGSELLSLPVPLEAQHWMAGGYYVTNTDDSCTVIPASSIVMTNYVKQLVACDTQLSTTGGATLQAGKLPGAGLVLSRPNAGHQGSVDLQLNVTAQPYGASCVRPAASLATAANMPWFGANPVARAAFGIYKSRLIYSRENY